MAGERQVHTHSTLNKAADHGTELIMKDVAQNAEKAIKDVNAANNFAPDPSFTLQLSDETLSGSNLLAFQKFFDGKFQFDIFYESRSAQNNLSGICLYNCYQFSRGLTFVQPLHLTKESPHFPIHSTSVFLRNFPFLIPQDDLHSKHFHKQSLRTCSVGLDTFMAHRS